MSTFFNLLSGCRRIVANPDEPSQSTRRPCRTDRPHIARHVERRRRREYVTWRVFVKICTLSPYSAIAHIHVWLRSERLWLQARRDEGLLHERAYTQNSTPENQPSRVTDRSLPTGRGNSQLPLNAPLRRWVIGYGRIVPARGDAAMRRCDAAMWR